MFCETCSVDVQESQFIEHQQMHANERSYQNSQNDKVNQLKNQDLYKLLEIPVDSTEEVLRKAFKVKSLANHPDKVSVEHKQDAEVFMKILNDAKVVLLDSDRRISYNKFWKEKFSKVKCDVCGEKLMLDTDLAIHKKLKHTKLKLIQCRYCVRVFLSQATLNKHEIKSHNKCKVCLKTFLTTKGLNSHMKIHFKANVVPEIDLASFLPILDKSTNCLRFSDSETCLLDKISHCQFKLQKKKNQLSGLSLKGLKKLSNDIEKFFTDYQVLKVKHCILLDSKPALKRKFEHVKCEMEAFKVKFETFYEERLNSQ